MVSRFSLAGGAMVERVIVFATIGLIIACSGDPAPPKPGPGDGGKLHSSVIYGSDNRQDLIQVRDPTVRTLAASTAALVRDYRVNERADGNFDLTLNDYGADWNLCASEPFRNQGLTGFCSGFFVGDDIMVTAGHCIRTVKDCENTTFVFDFAVQANGLTPKVVGPDQVYRCSDLVQSSILSNGADFAVVRLDRPVTGRQPLQLRERGTAQPGEELTVIGNPMGLPTKVAGQGIVRSVMQGFLTASLDTYGGNSGSAVFNSVTGEVEGILVRGDMDFKFAGNCRVSNVCGQNDCRGEDITRIEYVRNVVKLLGGR
jgi:hypothetical protein